MPVDFSLLSPQFIALSGVAVLLVTGLSGRAREIAFLAINSFFLSAFVLGPTGLLWTVAFCLIGHALAQLTARQFHISYRLGLPLFIVLFIYMRNYGFLGWLIPAEALSPIPTTVGLSFLFFKMVHILVETRSGTIGSLKLPHYLNYCLNFTTFIMGPIQRYRDYSEQWEGNRQAIPLTFEAHLDAILRILVGLFKSYVLAVWISPYANLEPTTISDASRPELWLSVFAFYFYLYFNFAGYCDVVIGVGSLFGVRPPENFDKPFLAKNIAEFWTRQHRTLTLWLTDYIFNPLYKTLLTGDQLRSRPLTAMSFSLLVTMIVSGLWHGTTASFLVFGLVHGGYLIVYRNWDAFLLRRLGRKGLRQWRKNQWVRLSGMGLTFLSASFAFLFFRLDLHSALQLLGRLVGT